MTTNFHNHSHHKNGTSIPPNNSQQKLVASDYLAKNSNRERRNFPNHGGGRIAAAVVIGGGGEFLPNSDSDQSLGSSSRRGRISTGQWITVIILCYVNLINYMDRFTIAGKPYAENFILPASYALFFVLQFAIANRYK